MNVAEEVNWFIIRCDSKDMGVNDEGVPIKSNWCSMKLKYEEYGLTVDRMLQLTYLQQEFLESLKKDILEYHNDPLSNTIAIHVTGTENQADGEFYVGGFHKTLWFKKRVPVWTASNFLVCYILFLFQVDILYE